MVCVELTVQNALGFHARAAGKFVQEAAKFRCEVWLAKGSNRVNGKSIMGILTLAAAKGEKVVLETDGPDEQEALNALSHLIRDGFGEGKKDRQRE